MYEIFWVLFSIALLGIFSPLLEMLPTSLMVELGFFGLGFGLLVGIPSGLWYHVELYRALTAKLQVPSRWWLSPTDYHLQLAHHELTKIRPWYLLGASAFTIALAGGLTAMIGLLIMKNP